MLLRTWRFFTIMLTAIALAAALAHLMELPGKMTYDARLYVMLHRTLYPTFGQTAGWAEGLALLFVIPLAWRVRNRRAAFAPTVIAAVCEATSMAVFLAFVQPANLTMADWPLDAIPSDWTGWRDQWEYGHAARAVLLTVALGALVLSLVKETPPEAGSDREEENGGRRAMSREAPAFPVVDVECYAGYRGEQMPRRFRLGERQIEITEVVDSWLAPDHRYFKVHDTQGDLYILRNDVAGDRWEVTLFRRRENREGRSSDAARS